MIYADFVVSNMFSAILRTVGKKKKKKKKLLSAGNKLCCMVDPCDRKKKKNNANFTETEILSCSTTFFLHYNRETDSLSQETGASAIAVFLNHFFHVKNSHEFSLSKVWLQMHALLTFSGRHVIIDHIIISQLEGPVQ